MDQKGFGSGNQGPAQQAAPSVPPQAVKPAAPPLADKAAQTQPVSKPAPNPQPETPPPSPPTFSPEVKTSSSGSKKWIFIVLVFVLIFAGVCGGAYFYITRHKEKVGGLTKKQIDKFSKLEKLYGDILKEVRKSTKEEEKSVDLLRALGNKEGESATAKGINLLVKKLEGDKDLEAGFDNINSLPVLMAEDKQENFEAVLGLEDSEEIAQLRKLIEYYRAGVVTANEIGNLNLEVKNEYKMPLAGLYLPKNSDLFNKTDKFSKDTTTLLVYLDEVNKVLLNYFTYMFELGVVFQEAIAQRGHSLAVEKLQTKINELDEIKGQYLAINTSGLSNELIKEHSEGLISFTEVKGMFNDLLSALKRKDVGSLVRIARSMTVEGATAGESSVVDTVSFWQNNPTVRSTQDLKREWQELSKNFK